jgi:hypothetical protein
VKDAGVVQDGDEIARFKIRPGAANPHMQSPVGLVVAINEPTLMGGPSPFGINQLLTTIIDHIENDVIPPLMQFL